MLIVAVSLTTVDAYFVKPPWRQVAADILNYRLDNEPVIMDVWVDDFALRYHLGRDLSVEPTTLPLISIPEWLDTYQQSFFPHLLSYISDKPSIWMADWGKDEDGVLTFLHDHGFVMTATQIETHLETNLIRVYRFDRVPTTPPLVTYADKLALVRELVSTDCGTRRIAARFAVVVGARRSGAGLQRFGVSGQRERTACRAA